MNLTSIVALWLIEMSLILSFWLKSLFLLVLASFANCYGFRIMCDVSSISSFIPMRVEIYSLVTPLYYASILL